jgi:pimeloyl-ACP methyl ester carboxylesterase
MTQFLDHEGGRLSYDVIGDGPLVVLSPGMGDLRQSYRFLAPKLARAGYRVASVDLRGHGDSSLGWPSITRTDVAGDLIALIRHLGGPAVIVGQSLSGGAATIAAASQPALLTGIVEINPFTRVPKINIGTQIFHSLRLWRSYLNVAYPTKPADAQAQLPGVRCPALIIMGAEDPDFPDPKAEGQAIVAALPAGLGSVAVIPGAGHYAHAQTPDQVAALLTATRAYVTAHPGRYTATVGAEFSGPDDPLLAASGRVLESIAAVLRGYGIAEDEMTHAIRTLRCTFHGFAALQAARGFQWSGDPEESFHWMISFLDRGLTRTR